MLANLYIFTSSSNWLKISNLISSFQFQSFFLVLQNWYIKIMLLGWLVGFWDGSLCWNFTTTMLIFQHKFSIKHNNADNSAYMLIIQQHQYHKLKNCPSQYQQIKISLEKFPFLLQHGCWLLVQQGDLAKFCNWNQNCWSDAFSSSSSSSSLSSSLSAL